jgi:hypothetical protein
MSERTRQFRAFLALRPLDLSQMSRLWTLTAGALWHATSVQRLLKRLG